MTAQTSTRKRRQPTAAQRAAAEERRARFRALAEQVAALDESQRAALAARAGITTIEGHALSPFNSCLALQQREDVSVVGGFQQWRRAGRCVRKGEHGLAIWIPSGKRAEETDDDDEDERPRFIMGTVFDISQTDPIAAAS